jgi:hypothetical protein
VLAAALVVGSAAPASAAPIGAVAAGQGVVATTDGARAVVSWDGKTETIDLAIGIEAPAGVIGIILPTPARATVEPGDTGLFTAVDSVIAPRQHVEDDWWGRTEPPVAAAAPVAPVPLGDVEPATIKATNRKALNAWLTKNKLVLSDDDRTQVAEYASDGWSLSAIAVNTAGATGGEFNPIRISFATDEFIVPLRLAASQQTPATLRMYVVADHRTEFRQSGKKARTVNAAQSVVWAGPVTSPALRDRGDYLTVTDLHFDDPSEQVTSDLVVVDSAADDPLQTAVVVFSPITLLGFPLGWLLVVWGGIGLLVGLGYVLNRFRSQ